MRSSSTLTSCAWLGSAGLLTCTGVQPGSAGCPTRVSVHIALSFARAPSMYTIAISAAFCSASSGAAYGATGAGEQDEFD